jgi:hypothetical protein
MATLREKLYAEGRMNFPPEKKVVRPGGGVMSYVSGRSSPQLKLPSDEVPFVGHTAILAVRRRSEPDTSVWYRTEWAETVAAVDGVHGVASFDVIHLPGEQLEIVYFEGDPVDQTAAIRAAAPHAADGEILADAPYLLINYLEQPWAESIRTSWLPKTVG